MRAKRLWVALVLCLLGLPTALWLAGTALSWPARAAMPAPPNGAEAVAFVSGSGATIRGWLFAGQAGQGVVLLLHGVRANRLETSSRADFLRQAGYGVLQIDQQAHGESTGDHELRQNHRWHFIGNTAAGKRLKLLLDETSCR